MHDGGTRFQQNSCIPSVAVSNTTRKYLFRKPTILLRKRTKRTNRICNCKRISKKEAKIFMLPFLACILFFHFSSLFLRRKIIHRFSFYCCLFSLPDFLNQFHHFLYFFCILFFGKNNNNALIDFKCLRKERKKDNQKSLLCVSCVWLRILEPLTTQNLNS